MHQELIALPPSDAYSWAIDPSLFSLHAWHGSVCHFIQIQYLRLSQLKPIPWSTRLSGVTTTRFATFTKSFYGLPIGSFSTFKGPLQSLAKTPLKCLVSGLSLSNSAVLNFQCVLGHAGIPLNKLC